MDHLDHSSPHFNDAKMARFLLLRAFIIALGGGGGLGDNCSILYCPRLQAQRITESRSQSLRYPFPFRSTRVTEALGTRLPAPSFASRKRMCVEDDFLHATQPGIICMFIFVLSFLSSSICYSSRLRAIFKPPVEVLVVP